MWSGVVNRERTAYLLDSGERKQLTFDIAHVKSLPNWTMIDLRDTGVTGDIFHLKSLLNLTDIRLYSTGVSGDIAHLKSLPNLTTIRIFSTGVSGDKEAFEASRKWYWCGL